MVLSGTLGVLMPVTAHCQRTRLRFADPAVAVPMRVVGVNEFPFPRQTLDSSLGNFNQRVTNKLVDTKHIRRSSSEPVTRHLQDESDDSRVLSAEVDEVIGKRRKVKATSTLPAETLMFQCPNCGFVAFGRLIGTFTDAPLCSESCNGDAPVRTQGSLLTGSQHPSPQVHDS